MKVKDILKWAEENDIFDLATFIKRKLSDKTLYPDEDENKIWMAMQRGRFGYSKPSLANKMLSMPSLLGQPEKNRVCNCVKLTGLSELGKEYSGKIINEKEASSTESCNACHESRRIFKKGIIGQLTQKQVKKYCNHYIQEPDNYIPEEEEYGSSNEIKIKIRKIGQQWIIETLGRLSETQENIVDSFRTIIKSGKKILRTFDSLPQAEEIARNITSKLNLSPKDIIVSSTSYGKNEPNYSGIVINEEKASSGSCHGKYPQKQFHKGIIGALSTEQREKYCTGKELGIVETPYLNDEIKRIIKELEPTLNIKNIIRHIKYKYPDLLEKDIKKIIEDIRSK